MSLYLLHVLTTQRLTGSFFTPIYKETEVNLKLSHDTIYSLKASIRYFTALNLLWHDWIYSLLFLSVSVFLFQDRIINLVIGGLASLLVTVSSAEWSHSVFQRIEMIAPAPDVASVHTGDAHQRVRLPCTASEAAEHFLCCLCPADLRVRAGSGR